MSGQVIRKICIRYCHWNCIIFFGSYPYFEVAFIPRILSNQGPFYLVSHKQLPFYEKNNDPNNC